MKVFPLFLATASCFAQMDVGQLLITYIAAEKADEKTRTFLQEHKPGGIIYYNWSNTLDSPEQVKALSEGLQAQAKELGLPDLIIATDQEGGHVARLRKGFTEFPGNGAQGYVGDENLVFRAAQAMGEQMLEVGVNFVFAPVVDVNANPNNPVIGVRSYGADPDLVTKLGKAAVRGYSSVGLLSSLKHFPGHGDVDADSHYALPTSHKSRVELDATDLKPFRELQEMAPAIMSAHVHVPVLDEKDCATLSKPILTGLLREEMGYEGLIVSDSITMGAVLKSCGDIGEAAVRTVEAGADLVIIGGATLNKTDEEAHLEDINRVREALNEAVESGRLSEERLQASFDRIALAKSKLPEGVVTADREKAEKCAREIAERSVQGSYPDLWNKKVAIVKPPEQMEYEGADRIIFIARSAWKKGEWCELLRELSSKYPTTLIVARDAKDAELEHSAEHVITTLSEDATSFQVAFDRMVRASVERPVTREEMHEMGMKIWTNECAQRVDQLIYWKEGEQWPSIGIGHFIWPPEAYQGTFKDGRFHHVLAFFEEKGMSVPEWMGRHAPWNTEAEYLADSRKDELLEFILSTVPLQAEYMTQRLWDAIPSLVRDLDENERHLLIGQVRRLRETPNGLFVLIDYLNFKHEGTAPSEEYQGERWGLKQVLLGMSEEGDPIEAFVTSAKERLTARVAASPPERNEKQWIPGWFNRLDRYVELD